MGTGTSTAPFVLGRDASLLLVSVIVTGLAAAVVTKSGILGVSTGALAVAIVRSGRTSAFEAPAMDALPPEVQHAVDRALAHLDDDSDAERLLRDVVRQARPLYDAHDSAFDAAHDAATRANTSELVVECCDVALQLGQVDELRSGEIIAAQNADDRALTRAKYDATRTSLARQLTDAASTLASLYVAGVEHGTPASDRVAELVQELKGDAAARGEARAEVQRLLSER